MMDDSFDAFISYRRSDAASFARRLRRALRDFPIPMELRGSKTPFKIYLDTMYERATKDFYELVTRPALLSSRNLIVVATPQSVDRGANKPDWIRQEVIDFENGPNAGNVMVVLARDLGGAALPGDLQRRYPNLELIDLRSFNRFSFFGVLRSARQADELVKLVAPLLGVGRQEMPVLRREEESRRQARLGTLLGAASATILAVASLSAWALYSRHDALNAISRSLFATDRVIQSVARTMEDGETRSNILVTACDLLDSLGARSVSEPRTNAIIICAIQRASKHDEHEELSQSSALLNAAISFAEDQYARSRRADDALAIIEAKAAVMDRASRKLDPAVAAKETESFIDAGKRLSNEQRADSGIPNRCAEALQTQAVGLGERRLFSSAITAASASIELRTIAIERGAPLESRLERVVAFALTSRLLGLNGQAVESARIAETANNGFAEISRDEMARAGLADSYDHVAKMIASSGN